MRGVREDESEATCILKAHAHVNEEATLDAVHAIRSVSRRLEAICFECVFFFLSPFLQTPLR